MKFSRLPRLFPFLIFSVLLFFFWRGLSLNPHQLPSVKIGQALPTFSLPILGETNEILNSSDLLQRNQVLLINIWASWCDACVDEQLFLMQLKKQGIPIFGINYKDTPEEARQWLKHWGNPYKKTAEDRTGKFSMELGVYGTPETFLIDKKGIIRYRHVGVLNETIWQQQFVPIIKKLEGRADVSV